MKDYEVKFNDDMQNYTIDFSDRLRQIAEKVSQMEAEFEDDAIRARLIELGWTPPAEGNQHLEEPTDK
jgi:hypothetical protein